MRIVKGMKIATSVIYLMFLSVIPSIEILIAYKELANPRYKNTIPKIILLLM